MGYSKGADGLYHINGRTFKKLIGSRAEVMHETAYKTSGGLTKADLIKNKNGRIVSKKKHNFEKKTKRLLKYGYTAKKGRFGAVRVGSSSRKFRGGLSMQSLSGMKGSLSSGLNKLQGAMKKGGYAPPSASYSNYNETPMITGSGGYRQTRSNRVKGRGRRYRGGYSGPLAPMTPLSQANLGFSKYVTPEVFTPETDALMSGL